MLLFSPRKLSNIWGTFVAKFVTKNFQKSPNLVKLLGKINLIFHAFFFLNDPFPASFSLFFVFSTNS